jgi:hypothetical protein
MFEYQIESLVLIAIAIIFFFIGRLKNLPWYVQLSVYGSYALGAYGLFGLFLGYVGNTDRGNANSKEYIVIEIKQCIAQNRLKNDLTDAKVYYNRIRNMDLPSKTISLALSKRNQLNNLNNQSQLIPYCIKKIYIDDCCVPADHINEKEMDAIISRKFKPNNFTIAKRMRIVN